MDLDRYDVFIDKTGTQALLDLRTVNAWLSKKLETEAERALHQRVEQLLEELTSQMQRLMTVVTRKILEAENAAAAEKGGTNEAA
ncbi:hypothetical protein MTYP_00683 [Methylophilaceae bacterium]|nr:hypothetical protein MTYP_00683 [Methylophilaceae bacterium]